jgi:hypothetical protein
VEATSTLPSLWNRGASGKTPTSGPTHGVILPTRLGVSDHLFARIPFSNERAPSHDPGKVLVHGALMLAGGTQSSADIDHLRSRPASNPTLYRTFYEITPEASPRVAEAQKRAQLGRSHREGERDRDHARVICRVRVKDNQRDSPPTSRADQIRHHFDRLGACRRSARRGNGRYPSSQSRTRTLPVAQLHDHSMRVDQTVGSSRPTTGRSQYATSSTSPLCTS